MKKLSDYPEYNQANEKLTSLMVDLNKADATFQERIGTINALSRDKRNRLDKVTIEAQAVLDGGEISNLTDEMTAAQRSVAELQHKIKVMRKAIELQRSVLAGIKSKISNEIAIAMKPDYVKQIANICKTLIQLDKQLIDEKAFRDGLYQNDITYLSYFRPMPLHYMGTSNDINSHLSAYLLECEKYGFIKSSDLPEKLKTMVEQQNKPKPMLERAINKLNPDGWIGTNINKAGV